MEKFTPWRFLSVTTPTSTTPLTGRSRQPCNRARFCEWLQSRLRILRDVLFPDATQFTRDDITNTRNSHSWAHESPH
jgi:hypothetical protein